MDAACPLIGLSLERERLRAALALRESVLLIGPAGSGKSALIRAAMADGPPVPGIVFLRYSASLHRLLVDLTRSLIAAGHQPLLGLAHPDSDLGKWLSHQTSVHLKGLLWTAFEAEPGTLVIDGVDGGSFPMYRFLQRLYFAPGMAIVASARNSGSLGALSRLFWDPRQTIPMRPLKDADARRLFDLSADRFGLGRLDVKDFREKALESAHGNPGQIIEMCRLASDPRYVSGTHIKFGPLRIDVLMKFPG